MGEEVSERSQIINVFLLEQNELGRSLRGMNLTSQNSTPALNYLHVKHTFYQRMITRI